MKRRVALLVVLVSAFLIGWQTPAAAARPTGTGSLELITAGTLFIDGTYVTFVGETSHLRGSSIAVIEMHCTSVATGVEVQYSLAVPPLAMFQLATGEDATCFGQLWQEFRTGHTGDTEILLDTTPAFFVDG